MRRRLAVTTVVLAVLVGEWLGHSLSYFRVAGVPGLQAGLSGGVHAYMVPLGLALLVGGVAWAALWARAWVTLGGRLDRSAAALARLRRPLVGMSALGALPRGSSSSAPTAPSPSFAARVLALGAPMVLLQCSLFMIQEDLERAVHGLAGRGLAPLFEGYGAGAAIQGGVALVLATVLVTAMRLLRARSAAAELRERIARALWQRALRGTSSPQPQRSDVISAQLLLRATLWSRPPPVLAAV